MKISNTILWMVGAVVLIGLLGWAVARILNHPAGSSGTNDATSTVASSVTDGQGTQSGLEPLETYTSSAFGFAISYPSDLRTEPFSAFHSLNTRWRVNVPADGRGTAVVAIPVLRIDNSTSTKKAYPLFYDAEVRVGVSDSTADCYSQDDGYTMQTVAEVDINGVTWKKFIFGDAAMMQYVSGASYRVIRNGRCYVIEQIRTGSTYRDETMAEAYTDKQLDEIYERTLPIVLSFRFMTR
jgi:hypothetical protein